MGIVAFIIAPVFLVLGIAVIMYGMVPAGTPG
jgi:hypothetical protein